MKINRLIDEFPSHIQEYRNHSLEEIQNILQKMWIKYPVPEQYAAARFALCLKQINKWIGDTFYHQGQPYILQEVKYGFFKQEDYFQMSRLGKSIFFTSNQFTFCGFNYNTQNAVSVYSDQITWTKISEMPLDLQVLMREVRNEHK